MPNSNTRLQRTVTIALFISLAAQVRVDLPTVVTPGFVAGFDVVILAVLLYCYKDLSALYICFLSGIFSPLFRWLIAYAVYGSESTDIMQIIPDGVFFFVYGIIYTLIVKTILNISIDMANFPMVVVICDVFGNITELLFRTAFTEDTILSFRVILTLTIIAVIRTGVVMLIIVAVEYYSGAILSKEQKAKYLGLVDQATVLSEELKVMDKNVAEVESVMKQAYDLYETLKAEGCPARLVQQALSIATHTHEVKGDYNNVIGVLKELQDDKMYDQEMKMSEVIQLERTNVQSMIRDSGWNINIETEIGYDPMVRDSYRMMSMLRNLMTNSAEAIADAGGTITVRGELTREQTVNGRDVMYAMTVSDDGPGISEDEMDTIFLEGYSTKFDPDTGTIQRGLGLPLVKEYVENDMHGRIEITSSPGEGTQFSIFIPIEQLEADRK